MKRSVLLGALLCASVLVLLRFAPSTGVARRPPGEGAGVAPPADRSREGASAQAHVDATSSGDASAAMKPMPMELPPPDVPLAPVFPGLLRAARAGDPGAMCRVALEITRCGARLDELRRTDASYTDILVYGEPEPDQKNALLGMLARNGSKREELETMCAGVELPPDVKAWRLLRDAARAGHVPSMVRFGSNFPVDYDNMLEDLDALASYRDERIGFLERAAAAGNAKAAYVLFYEYSGNGGMFGVRSAQKDPVRALSYAIALEGIGSVETRKSLSKQATMLRHKLAQGDQREAERIAAGLAPTFAALRGTDADLRVSVASSGADCAATDPKALNLEPIRKTGNVRLQ